VTAGEPAERTAGPSWPEQRLALHGIVSEFDDHRGLGTVVDEGGASYRFHCTAIVDGSRHIAVGTPVTFAVRAGHLGRVEACSLSPGR